MHGQDDVSGAGFCGEKLGVFVLAQGLNVCALQDVYSNAAAST